MPASPPLFTWLSRALAVAGLRHVPANAGLCVRRAGRHHRNLGPGWHWVLPGLERIGPAVGLTGHHLHVPAANTAGEAELYYQILDPTKAGAALDDVDAWVTAQTRDVLAQVSGSAEQIKTELNQRIGRLGLRVVRCSLHLA